MRHAFLGAALSLTAGLSPAVAEMTDIRFTLGWKTQGSDAPFLLAVANVLFADEVVDVGELAPVLNGLEQLEALVARWTPESVAATCRIPADTIRRLAHVPRESRAGQFVDRNHPVGTGNVLGAEIRCYISFGKTGDQLEGIVEQSADRAGGRGGPDRGLR